MKLSLRLIAALVVSISLVTFFVARNQVRAEKKGLRADLARRGEILTESLQETVEPVLQRGSRQPTPHELSNVLATANTWRAWPSTIQTASCSPPATGLGRNADVPAESVR